MEQALISLGTEDMENLLTKEDGTVVRCEFCRQSYTFGSDDLGALLSIKSKKA